MCAEPSCAPFVLSASIDGVPMAPSDIQYKPSSSTQAVGATADPAISVSALDIGLSSSLGSNNLDPGSRRAICWPLITSTSKAALRTGEERCASCPSVRDASALQACVAPAAQSACTPWQQRRQLTSAARCRWCELECKYVTDRVAQILNRMHTRSSLRAMSLSRQGPIVRLIR